MSFKIGDKVKVVKKFTQTNPIYWDSLMDNSVGKVFTVVENGVGGGLYVNEIVELDNGWLYPIESLQLANKGQLLFSFMYE